jgi:polysaccharide export outer membrane protein
LLAVTCAGWALCLLGPGCEGRVSYAILGGSGAMSAPASPSPVAAPQASADAPAPSVAADGTGGAVPAAAISRAGGAGCPPGGCGPEGTAPDDVSAPPDAGKRPLPTELRMLSHPTYVIEPPDILLIDTLRMIPRPPYVVQPLDVLLIRVAESVPGQPIEGPYTVAPDGFINLGYVYGAVRVGGLSLEAAEVAIRKHLARFIREPQVAVGLSQFRAVQQVRGEHLVRPDGTISLGTYGSVYVTGMTLAQARCAVEEHLAQFVLDPEVSLDVFAYNSKVYYVIADGGGYGQLVFRFPVTGKETVLDGVGQVLGLPAVASTRHIWVARPAPPEQGCVQILPVDWRAITEGGSTATNYQLFPGDRIYLKADPLITLDNTIAKVVAPVERLLGLTLLGASTVNSFRTNGNNVNNGFIATVR